MRCVCHTQTDRTSDNRIMTQKLKWFIRATQHNHTNQHQHTINVLGWNVALSLSIRVCACLYGWTHQLMMSVWALVCLCVATKISFALGQIKTWKRNKWFCLLVTAAVAHKYFLTHWQEPQSITSLSIWLHWMACVFVHSIWSISTHIWSISLGKTLKNSRNRF